MLAKVGDLEKRNEGRLYIVSREFNVDGRTPCKRLGLLHMGLRQCRAMLRQPKDKASRLNLNHSRSTLGSHAHQVNNVTDIMFNMQIVATALDDVYNTCTGQSTTIARQHCVCRIRGVDRRESQGGSSRCTPRRLAAQSTNPWDRADKYDTDAGL